MRIAICDESNEQRETLLQMIRAELSGEPISYQIREYMRAEDLVYDVQDGESPDIAFVDMAMPHGWECVGTLRRLRFDGDVILMSDCGARAVDGYTLEADGYLMKPFDAFDVGILLRRLCVRARKACLTVSRHCRISRIPFHKILYIESRNAKCVIHCTDREACVVYAQLDDLEKRLDDPRFMRCHQSYLVNMDHIVCADKQFEMVNGDTVSIRQRALHRIREDYLAYLRSIDGRV